MHCQYKLVLFISHVIGISAKVKKFGYKRHRFCSKASFVLLASKQRNMKGSNSILYLGSYKRLTPFYSLHHRPVRSACPCGRPGPPWPHQWPTWMSNCGRDDTAQIPQQLGPHCLLAMRRSGTGRHSYALRERDGSGDRLLWRNRLRRLAAVGVDSPYVAS